MRKKKSVIAYWVILAAMIIAVLAWDIKMKYPLTSQPESTMEDRHLTEVDSYFEQALDAYEKEQYQKAADYVSQAAAAIETNIDKNPEPIEASLRQELKAKFAKMEENLRAEKIRTAAQLKQLFATAIITVSHNYLLLDEILLLHENNKLNAIKTNRIIDRDYVRFNDIIMDLPKPIKAKGLALSKETEVLLEERAALNLKLRNQINKMHDFVKEHKPNR